MCPDSLGRISHSDDARSKFVAEAVFGRVLETSPVRVGGLDARVNEFRPGPSNVRKRPDDVDYLRAGEQRIASSGQ